MKKAILSLGAVFIISSIHAQTTLMFEDFESGPGNFTLNTSDEGGVVGSAGDNEWVVNNVYTGGSGTVAFCAIALGSPFTVGNTPAQPGGISNSNGGYLHVLSDEAANSGILNSNYALAEGLFCIFAASHFTSMTADVSTSAMNNVTLNFWWLNDGSPEAIGEVWYSLDAGTSWIQITSPFANYTGQNAWIQQSITDPAWDNQSTLRFGFRFNNTVSSTGTDPSFSIDDVEITADAVACTNTFSNFSETACLSYTVPSGDETYTAPGTGIVMDTITNSSGCDSIMTINLTINTVDTTVTDLGGGELSANSITGTYQWLQNCDTSPIVMTGETNQVLTNTGIGYFSVIVTESGCTDTSGCHYVDWWSLDEYSNPWFEIFPNPTSGNFNISLTSVQNKIELSITDINGKLVLTDSYYNIQFIEGIQFEGESGIYIITLSDGEGNVRRSKLVKE